MCIRDSYKTVTQFLIKETPPGWLQFLRKFMRTDRILPEGFDSLTLPQEALVGMKILHFENDQDCFILRPGQSLEMDKLEIPDLKRVYCYIKVLRDILKVTGVKSYMIKKILLLPEFYESASRAYDEVELLYLALSHPLLYAKFSSYIRFDRWNNKIVHAKRNGQQQEGYSDHSHRAIPLMGNWAHSNNCLLYTSPSPRD